MVEVEGMTGEQAATVKSTFPDHRLVGWKAQSYAHQGIVAVLLDPADHEVYVRLDTFEVVA